MLPDVQVFPQGVMIAFEWSTLLLYVGAGAAFYFVRRLRRKKAKNG